MKGVVEFGFNGGDIVEEIFYCMHKGILANKLDKCKYLVIAGNQNVVYAV
jgi:hypothetical protein